jgi:hypothetical protein
MSAHVVAFKALALLLSSSTSSHAIRREQCSARARPHLTRTRGVNAPLGPRLEPVAGAGGGVVHAPTAVLERIPGRQRTPADAGAEPLVERAQLAVVASLRRPILNYER